MNTYTIGHMPATGGTIVSKVISSCLDLVLISELSPYQWILHPKQKIAYDPTSLLKHLVAAIGDLPDRLKEDYFLSQHRIAKRHLRDQGRSLLYRDHSFTTFNFKDGTSRFLDLLHREEKNPMHIPSIRHLLDSFLSSISYGWVAPLSPDNSLDGYCKKLLFFTKCYKQYQIMHLIRYEDLCIDPGKQVTAVANYFGLDFDLNKIESAIDVPATGFSGRKTTSIELRPRRLVPDHIIKEANSSQCHNTLCCEYGYETDPESSSCISS